MSNLSIRPSRLVTTLSALLAAAIPAAGLRADITGFGNTGTGFSLNSGATVSNGVATLTDGNINEARSVFYGTPQAIGGFNVAFTYHESASLLASGEGVAFVVQKDPRGATAVGQGGTLLGYGGATAITPSAAVELNLLNVAGVAASSTNYAVNGALTGNSYNLGASVNLNDGDAIRVNLAYDGSTLTETLTDLTNNGAPATYTYAAGSLTSLLGSGTAYVGFTGSTGALASTQTISDFSFTSVPESAAWGPAGAGGLLLLTLTRLYRRNARTADGQL